MKETDPKYLAEKYFLYDKSTVFRVAIKYTPCITVYVVIL